MRTVSLDYVRKNIPSVFAESRAANTSDRFQHVNSGPFIEFFIQNGWEIVGAYESRANSAEKSGHTKHCVKMVHRDFNLSRSLSVGDTYPGVTLINASDGSSSLRLIRSIYRLVCGNGMTVEDSVEQAHRYIHKGDILEQLRHDLPDFLSGVQDTANQIQQFSEIQLTEKEQMAYAAIALDLRWSPKTNEDGVVVSTAPIHAERLLVPRRAEDSAIKNTLWGTTQIVQENILRGGMRGIGSTGRRTTVQEVKSVDNDVRLNTALWKTSEAVALVKAS